MKANSQKQRCLALRPHICHSNLKANHPVIFHIHKIGECDYFICVFILNLNNP